MMNAYIKTVFLMGLMVSSFLPGVSFAQSVNNNATSNDKAVVNDAVPLDSESKIVSDNCYSLNTNERWQELFSLFSAAYKEKQYEQALSYMRDLQDICDRSPVLNFAIATTYREMGDNEEALKYYHKATGNTAEFSVSPEMQQKFWYAQYEVENMNNVCVISELDKCKKDRDDYKAALENTTLNDELIKAKSVAESRYKAIMWTGIGVGIAGVALTATGAALAATNTSVNSVTQLSNDHYSVKLKAGYTTGLVLLGTGIGAVVTGAIMAGIGGYQYAHQDNQVAITWGISPTDIQFGLTF